jgi:hypothetical protein
MYMKVASKPTPRARPLQLQGPNQYEVFDLENTNDAWIHGTTDPSNNNAGEMYKNNWIGDGSEWAVWVFKVTNGASKLTREMFKFTGPTSTSGLLTGDFYATANIANIIITNATLSDSYINGYGRYGGGNIAVQSILVFNTSLNNEQTAKVVNNLLSGMPWDNTTSFTTSTITPYVPSTGSVKMSDIKAAFGNQLGNSLLSYKNKHASLSSASLTFLQFRGLTAPTPKFVFASTLGTNLAFNVDGSVTGNVSSGAGQHSVNFQDFMDTSSGQGTQFSVLPGALPSGAALSSSGVLSMNFPPGTSIVNPGIYVKATNLYGNNATFQISYKVEGLGMPAIKLPIPDQMLSNNTASLDMTSYFIFADQFQVVVNPKNNTSFQGSTLYINGQTRNTSYVIKVRGFNALGEAFQYVTVREYTPVYKIKDFDNPITIDEYNPYRTLTIGDYFGGSIEGWYVRVESGVYQYTDMKDNNGYGTGKANFTISGTPSGTTLSLSVTAFDCVGNGATSSSSVVTAVRTTPQPTPPQPIGNPIYLSGSPGDTYLAAGQTRDIRYLFNGVIDTTQLVIQGSYYYIDNLNHSFNRTIQTTTLFYPRDLDPNRRLDRYTYTLVVSNNSGSSISVNGMVYANP